MISISTILILLLVHWLADFVMQTDWQAKNKSSSNEALLMHTGTYGLVLVAACAMIGLFSGVTFLEAVSWGLVNVVLHTATDYVTSRINKKLWAEGKVHEFFVCVGFDQFLHYAALILTWVYFFGG